jgi:hypothetical protein
MINLFAASMIMRSKVLMHRWLIIRAKMSHKCNLLNLKSCFFNFDLTIVLVANKSIMRLKFLIMLFLNFDLMIVLVTNKLIMRSKFLIMLLFEF